MYVEGSALLFWLVGLVGTSVVIRRTESGMTQGPYTIGLLGLLAALLVLHVIGGGRTGVPTDFCVIFALQTAGFLTLALLLVVHAISGMAVDSPDFCVISALQTAGFLTLVWLVARRCNDMGWSKWWTLLLLIPLLGPVVMISVCFFRSYQGSAIEPATFD